VAEALGISVRSLDRMIEAEEFPRPVRFGRQLRWRRSVVEAHLQKLEAAAQAN
jgi:predicted DNA-binding transcriptional regulator AlpA